MNERAVWDRRPSLYVSDRHRLLHDDAVAKGIVALIDSPAAIVLDHGCGEASAADRVAARCARLYLFDASAEVEEGLRRRFSGNDKIVVVSNAALEALPEQSLDLVVAHSLIQHLGRDEFETLLDFWRRRLKTSGKLVLADVIGPDLSVLEDARALLAFGFAGGFFWRACAGLLAAFFSDARKLRQDVGVTRYRPDDMHELLAAHGFAGTRAQTNIGYNSRRMMFIATPTHVR